MKKYIFHILIFSISNGSKYEIQNIIIFMNDDKTKAT